MDGTAAYTSPPLRIHVIEERGHHTLCRAPVDLHRVDEMPYITIAQTRPFGFCAGPLVVIATAHIHDEKITHVGNTTSAVRDQPLLK